MEELYKAIEEKIKASGYRERFRRGCLRRHLRSDRWKKRMEAMCRFPNSDDDDL